MEITNITFTSLLLFYRNGREVIMEGLVEAMNVSMGRLELTTEFFLVPSSSSTPSPSPPTYLPPATPSVGILRKDMWVAPLLIFSSLTMVLIALFEVSSATKDQQLLVCRHEEMNDIYVVYILRHEELNTFFQMCIIFLQTRVLKDKQHSTSYNPPTPFSAPSQ